MDDTLKEDACRVRTGHALKNLALMRQIVLNVLNREQSFQLSDR